MNAENLETYKNALNLLNNYDLNQAKSAVYLDIIGQIKQIRQLDFINYAVNKKLTEHIKQIRGTITQLTRQNRKIETIINRVEGDTERGVITDRIINGMQWEAIADKYAYCARSNATPIFAPVRCSPANDNTSSHTVFNCGHIFSTTEKSALCTQERNVSSEILPLGNSALSTSSPVNAPFISAFALWKSREVSR